MSSLRNAVQRRPHRERAQPLERRRLGVLEKHKDYSLRAKDYNKKKEHLKNLRQKAAERNEDEFYFGMVSRKGPGSKIQDGKNWRGTVDGDRGFKSLDVDTVRLLKTQDLGYVRTMKQVVAKEVAKLEEQVVLTRGLDRLDEALDNVDDENGNEYDDSSDDGLARLPKKRHTARNIVFADDEDERETTRDKMEADGSRSPDDAESADEEPSEKDRSLKRLQQKLKNGRKKLSVLNSAEIELELQRAKMAKTATSGGYTKRGKKIMVRTRKR